MSIRFQGLRRLEVEPATHPRGAAFLSAASGLVRIGRRLWVVADDEQHLGVFVDGGAAPLRLVRIAEGELPADAKARKKAKGDFEALLAVPPAAGWPDGALLAFGSGSRPQRFGAALLPLDRRGEPAGPARRLDLEPLYAPLVAACGEPNVEGAFISGDALVLLQRGGDGGRANAALRWPWPMVEAWLAGAAPRAMRPASLQRLALGEIDGVALGFTDGAALPDGAWLFSAVAEGSDNSYDDGACAGAALGVVGRDGALRALHRLRPTRKIEGVEARVAGGRIEVGLVTDADDPSRPAEYGRASLPLS